jgi:hypothetical protein
MLQASALLVLIGSIASIGWALFAGVAFMIAGWAYWAVERRRKANADRVVSPFGR